jgi:hypothetical protein
MCEIRRQQSSLGEVLLENIQELEVSSGDELGVRQFRVEGPHEVSGLFVKPRGRQRMETESAIGRVVLKSLRSDLKEKLGPFVELLSIHLVEVSIGINQNMTLVGLQSSVIVSDDIVGKVVKNFEGDKEAGVVDGLLPIKNRLVDDLDLGPMTGLGRLGVQSTLLLVSQLVGNLNDLIGFARIPRAEYLEYSRECWS